MLADWLNGQSRLVGGVKWTFFSQKTKSYDRVWRVSVTLRICPFKSYSRRNHKKKAQTQVHIDMQQHMFVPVQRAYVPELWRLQVCVYLCLCAG